MEVAQQRRKGLGRIGVLMGGPSSEREVSLNSGQAVYETLKAAGLDAVAIDITTDDQEENIRLISSKGLDCAFVALHGRFGEDGQIQQLLDRMGIVYTGSSAAASRLAMDKLASRKLLQQAGVSVPRYCIAFRQAQGSSGPEQGGFSYLPEIHLDAQEEPWGFTFPVVVKPVTQGSSIGLSIVEKRRDLGRALELAFSFDEQVLIEEYIRGREITVGILGEEPLPVIEIRPKNKFFDYEAKYKPGMTEYIVPAELPPGLCRKVKGLALQVHRLLGCSGFSRCDMILSFDNTAYILELNSIPGLTSGSLLPKAAKNAGIEFLELCLSLLRMAYEKK